MMDSSAERLWREAQGHMSAGNVPAARQVLQALLQQQPRHPAAHMTLGHIAWSQGRVRESARHVLQAAANAPADAGAIVSIAIALLRVGEVVAARACLEHSALRDSEDPRTLMYHAGLRRQLGEDLAALAVLDRAHSLGTDGAEFRFVRGVEALICGRLDEAERDLETSLLMDPSAGAAALELARLRKQTPERNHLGDFNDRLSRIRKGTEDHAALEFARYKELEDLGRYADAWSALRSANAVMHALHPYDALEMERRIGDLVRVCTPEFLAARKTPCEGPQPIFVVGLPRSGTTLLDRLLGSHSQVTSAGELDDFGLQLCWAADQSAVLDANMRAVLPDLDYAELGQRYLQQTRWRAREKRFFIDKQPWNHMLIGLIAKALPDARIVHVMREPMDVCFSNFRAMLGARYSYSFDLSALASHYLQYRRLHEHWKRSMPDRVLDVSYADLVRDTRPTLRKVMNFCGLDWEPDCAEGIGNTAPVGTLSAVQARAPIHTRAFGEWRRYQRELAGLAGVLGQTGLVDCPATCN